MKKIMLPLVIAAGVLSGISVDAFAIGAIGISADIGVGDPGGGAGDPPADPTPTPNPSSAPSGGGSAASAAPAPTGGGGGVSAAPAPLAGSGLICLVLGGGLAGYRVIVRRRRRLPACEDHSIRQR